MKKGEKKETNEKVEEPVYQEVEVKKKEKEVRTDSYFDGGLLELIGWRILAFLITAITLGLANPWAQCMLYSWQYKHTVYNGKRLKFEGTGGDLFVNMFKWLFFSIITLGIYTFVIPVRKQRWIVSNLHFEDENLVKDESFFDGKTLPLIGINILSKIISVLSLGLLYPFAVCMKINWLTKHTIINRKKIVFDGNGFQLWGKYILWYLLTIITLGIFGLWLPIKMLKWKAKHIHIKVVGEEDKKDKTLFIIIPLAIILIFVVVYVLSIVIPNIMTDGGKQIELFFKNLVDGKMVSRSLDDREDLELYNYYKERYINGEITNADLGELLRDPRFMKFLQAEGDSEFARMLEASEDRVSTPTKSEPSTPSTPEPKPEKTSITVGGYTLKFGTYKGTIIQGEWDDEIMDSREVRHDVTLKLTESTITLNGESGSYSVSGTSLVWKGEPYIFQVSGNNSIDYMAENCPTLTYQGY